MSIDYPPRFKKAMLAAIGDTGSGMPFDSVTVELREGVAVVCFCQAGNDMVHVNMRAGERATVYATGTLPVEL